MREEYEFDKMKPVKRGPVADKDTKVVKTIRLNMDVVSWLVKRADDEGMPYQTLINSILTKAMRGESLEDRVKKLETEVFAKQA